MLRRRAGIAGFVFALGCSLAGAGCGGGKPAAGADNAAAAGPSGKHQGKPGDWCDPMPEPDDPCKTEFKECMVVCDYISDRCAMLVCMGSKWTYVEEEDEKAAKASE